MSGLYNQEILELGVLDPRAGSSSALCLWRHQNGVKAALAFFTPFLYPILVCGGSCWLRYMGLPEECIPDTCFSTVRARADAAGFMPNFFFIVFHSCLMMIIWTSGVSNRSVGILSVGTALISASFFFSELPHILLVAGGLSVTFFAFLWISIYAERRSRLLAVVVGIAVCCIGLLVCIVLGPYKGPTAYYKRPLFSVFEYLVILIIGTAYYLLCVEDGPHQRIRSMTPKLLP